MKAEIHIAAVTKGSQSIGWIQCS